MGGGSSRGKPDPAQVPSAAWSWSSRAAKSLGNQTAAPSPGGVPLPHIWSATSLDVSSRLGCLKSSGVLSRTGIVLGPSSPHKWESLLYPPSSTLAKPASCSFKLPRPPQLALDKKHCLWATSPARLFLSLLLVNHPPEQATVPLPRSCCPRAKLSVPWNNRAISKLPSASGMLPHSCHCIP